MNMLSAWGYLMKGCWDISTRTRHLLWLHWRLNRGGISLLGAINMRRYVSFDDKVRLATWDFDDFNLCFEGFRNDPMYMYNKGTAPIYI